MLIKFEASNKTYSFIGTTIPQIIGLILVPIISYRSDRFRSRWGRRIPFLLVSVPIVTTALVGVAFCPEIAAQLDGMLGTSSPGFNSCALIIFGILWAMFTIGGSIGGAVRGGLTNDVVPRPVLGRFAGMVRVLSLICGIIFNWFLFGLIKAHFRWIFLALAAVAALTMIIMCLKVKEGDYPPPPEVAGEGGLSKLFNSTKTYLVECFRNPYYRWVFMALALAGLSLGPVNGYILRYSEQMKLDTGIYGKIKATNHFCGMLFALPIGILADRFHPLRMTIVTLSLYALTLLMGSIFIQGPKTFAVAAFGHLFVSGLYISASGALGQMLLPRLKFAQFASAAGVITAIGTIVISYALAIFLDRPGINYRLTFIVGFAMTVVAVVVLLIVYRKFMALGGPKGYVAPT
jgi:MFS family permease